MKFTLMTITLSCILSNTCTLVQAASNSPRRNQVIIGNAHKHKLKEALKSNKHAMKEDPTSTLQRLVDGVEAQKLNYGAQQSIKNLEDAIQDLNDLIKTETEKRNNLKQKMRKEQQKHVDARCNCVKAGKKQYCQIQIGINGLTPHYTHCNKNMRSFKEQKETYEKKLKEIRGPRKIVTHKKSAPKRKRTTQDMLNDLGKRNPFADVIAKKAKQRSERQAAEEKEAENDVQSVASQEDYNIMKDNKHKIQRTEGEKEWYFYINMDGQNMYICPVAKTISPNEPKWVVTRMTAKNYRCKNLETGEIKWKVEPLAKYKDLVEFTYEN